MTSPDDPMTKAQVPANPAQPSVSANPVVNSETNPGLAISGTSRDEQASSATFDTSGLNQDELKREFDVFRDVLGNVNNTLRFQIQLSVTLLAACVTVLNLVPRKSIRHC